jgi:dTMP kinase
MRRRKGFLLTVEGVDGSGKSTQVRRIATYLKRCGHTVTLVREPGGTPLGERIRRWLLDRKRTGITPPTELCLYLAARGQVYADVIRPALEKGGVVLCDRFTDSTLAYQGFGRGISVPLLRTLNDLCTDSRRPDLSLFLDLSLSASSLRQGGKPDRIESEKTRFFRRVRRGYLQIAQDEPHRMVRIDARGSQDEVFRRIAGTLDGALKRSR